MFLSRACAALLILAGTLAAPVRSAEVPASLPLSASTVATDATSTEDALFTEQAGKAFADAIEQYRIPGLAVGVTHNGRHRFYTTGVASREDGSPVTRDTVFELGSMSKLFTVLLAAVAEQRGLLSLDMRADKFLCASACTLGENLTLMDLATHHSGGLPLQVPDNVGNVQGLVQWLKDWRAPQPGTRSYSNVSIGLLGYIAAQAMGASYPQAMQNVLLPELGLTSTWITVPPTQVQRYAFGYDRKTDKPIRVTPGVLDAEAYGMKSSVSDMLSFLDIVMGEKRVAPSIEAAIRRNREGQFQTAYFTQDMVWEQYAWPTDLSTLLAGNGNDFILKPQPMNKLTPAVPAQDNVILNKTGSTNGFGGYVAALPNEKLGVVVLANRNFPNQARISSTYALIQALLGPR